MINETCVASAFTELTDRNALPSMVATSHMCLLKSGFSFSVTLAAFHHVFIMWMEPANTGESSAGKEAEKAISNVYLCGEGGVETDGRREA